MNGCRRIIALGLWVLAACVFSTQVRAWQPHVLRFAEGIDVTTLNPFLATSGNVIDLSGLTMAYFVRYDTRRRPVPELITQIPTQANGGISADGRAITYRLRHGVRWSDGAPFDAGDVAYTLRVIADRNNRLTSHDAWDRVLRFEEPDKFTIVLHLAQPFAPFVARYFGSDGLGCVLPAHILGAHTNINEAPYNAMPVGIGPFRYTAFRRGDAIEMEANPYYFGRKPKLRKIVYSLVSEDNTLLTQLQTGELDMWAAVSGGFTQRVRSLPNVRSERVPTPYMSGIFFQTEHATVREAVVRRALRLATNRPYLFNVLYNRLGTLAESVVAPSTRDSAQLPQIPFDVTRANRLLDRSGWIRGPDGVRAKSGTRLSLTIAVLAGYAPAEQLAELLRSSWSAVGAEVTTKPSSSALFFAPADAGGTVQSGNFDVALLSQSSGVFADVSNSYGCAYRSPKGLNSTRYCNPAVDRELAAYTATYDAGKRATLARSFQQRIDDDAPMIPVYARAFLYTHTTHLTGFHPQTFGVSMQSRTPTSINARKPCYRVFRAPPGLKHYAGSGFGVSIDRRQARPWPRNGDLAPRSDLPASEPRVDDVKAADGVRSEVLCGVLGSGSEHHLTLPQSRSIALHPIERRREVDVPNAVRFCEPKRLARYGVVAPNQPVETARTAPRGTRRDIVRAPPPYVHCRLVEPIERRTILDQVPVFVCDIRVEPR